jgi:adenine-specific DNA glycosylase
MRQDNMIINHGFKLSRSKVPETVPLRLGIVLAGLLFLGACASTPQAPTRSLQAAEQAIASAEQARVADYASLELSQAREKLAAARVAAQREDMVVAQRLADEALVGAQLATAKAGEIKAKKVNEDMKESTRTLINEMDRNTGARQ